MRVRKRHLITVLGIAAATLALTACSSDTTGASSATTPATTQSATPTAAPAKIDPAADLVGSGCAAYAQAVPTDAGSVTGMSTSPVTVPAANDPLLAILAVAVAGKLSTAVNLVNTLNGGPCTVFAPVDDAFKKIDAATIATLETPAGAATRTKTLTYQVVAGQIAPKKIAGNHLTIQGGTLTVTGSGDHIMVNGATVICDGVHTAHATVYLIDTVLMPPTK
jgi:uncharacterized surface protein with fasciclin (FAS1) repeats